MPFSIRKSIKCKIIISDAETIREIMPLCSADICATKGVQGRRMDRFAWKKSYFANFMIQES